MNRPRLDRQVALIPITVSRATPPAHGQQHVAVLGASEVLVVGRTAGKQLDTAFLSGV
jgi:hypothetical protein